AGIDTDVAAMIEHGEGVAVLQGQGSPCLQRRAGGYVELRYRRFVRGQIIQMSAPGLSTSCRNYKIRFQKNVSEEHKLVRVYSRRSVQWSPACAMVASMR